MSDKIQTAPPISIELDEGRQPAEHESAITKIEQSRAVQEAQAQFVVAKRFPRDELRAEQRIVEACKRPSLAQVAEYSYSRGGTAVRGASIRLAETLARYWGNLRYGFRELSQAAGVSEVQAYCIDMETNTLQERVFQVKHVRYSKTGGLQNLTDPRDIYELIANQAARRIRACILAVIPGDVQEIALTTCEETLKGGGGKPLKDRIRKMLEIFKELGVSQDMIEARYRKKAESIDEIQLLELIRIHNSLRDGMSNVEDWFGDENESLKSTLKKGTQKAPGSRKAAGPPPAQTAPEPQPESLPPMEAAHQNGRGRLSSAEDRAFMEAVDALTERAIQGGRAPDFVQKVVNRLAAGQGGMDGAISIRNRDGRDKFLKDLGDMVDQWEKTPPPVYD